MEEPGGVEDGAVAAECEDEIEFLWGGPAEVGRPVTEHGFVAWVRGDKTFGVEAFGFGEFDVYINGNAEI